MAPNGLAHRVDALESKVDTHLRDGISVWKTLEEVKTDIQWIKRSFWCLAGAGITFNAGLALYIVEKWIH